MNCIICTSGVGNSFFSTLFHSTMNLTIFGAVLIALVIAALIACYRVGIAYTRLTQEEMRAAESARPVRSGVAGGAGMR